MKVFFCLSLLLLGVSLRAEPAKIYVLAVVDRFDPQVGVGCALGYDRLKKYFTDISRDPATGRPRFDLIEFFEWGNGKIPTEAEVVQYYQHSIPLKPNDVPWFYYCGHGAIDPTYGHYMITPAGSIVRSRVLDAMKSRNTQGRIITTDACSIGGVYREEGPIGQGGPPIIPDTFKTLYWFLANTTGTVDITAASPGHRAYVDPKMGGNFTLAMYNAFYQPTDVDGDGAVTWHGDMFPVIRDGTNSNFLNLANKVASLGTSYIDPADTDQIPQAFSLGQ